MRECGGIVGCIGVRDRCVYIACMVSDWGEKVWQCNLEFYLLPSCLQSSSGVGNVVPYPTSALKCRPRVGIVMGLVLRLFTVFLITAIGFG